MIYQSWFCNMPWQPCFHMPFIICEMIFITLWYANRTVSFQSSWTLDVSPRKRRVRDLALLPQYAALPQPVHDSDSDLTGWQAMLKAEEVMIAFLQVAQPSHERINQRLLIRHFELPNVLWVQAMVHRHVKWGGVGAGLMLSTKSWTKGQTWLR